MRGISITGVKQTFKTIGHLVWRFKYVVLVLIVLLGALIGWMTYQKANANKWERATDSYKRADYDAAAEILKDVAMPKSDSEKLNVYAQTMLATRQLDKAAEAYNRLYELKKDPFAKLLIGNVYNEKKDYDKAAEAYNQLIDADPTYVQAYVNLSTMYKIRGNNQAAIDTAKKAVKNNESNVTLLELLVSMTMQDKTSADYKEAVQKLKQVNPKDPLLVELNEVRA